MAEFVLTEYQGACRAAHEQAQLLEDLYERIVDRDAWREGTGYPVDQRAEELRAFRGLLQRALEKEDLLPTQPDPEKEELLELIAEVKGALTADARAAIAERLIAEEYGLLRLGEQMQGHSRSDAIEKELARTRAAIDRLKRATPADTGD